MSIEPIGTLVLSVGVGDNSGLVLQDAELALQVCGAASGAGGDSDECKHQSNFHFDWLTIVLVTLSNPEKRLSRILDLSRNWPSL